MANSGSPKTILNAKSIFTTSSPPKTWFKWGEYVRLAIAALLIVLAISGCSVSGGSQLTQWKDANSIVSESVLAKVISENTTVSLHEVKPLAFVASLPEDGKLVVFDFNSTYLCGFRRCTYAAYEVKKDRARQVWQEHFNPNLPPGTHLFSVASDSTFGQPCLIVNQVETNNIGQFKFCYNSRQIEEVENKLLEKRYL